MKGRTPMTADTSQDTTPRRLTRAEASAWFKTVYNINLSPRTLGNLASKGGGPKFRKAGARRVLHEESDLREYAESRLSPKVRTTGELHALRSASQSIPAHVGA